MLRSNVGTETGCDEFVKRKISREIESRRHIQLQEYFKKFRRERSRSAQFYFLHV
jgi:hypothetical protein